MSFVNGNKTNIEGRELLKKVFRLQTFRRYVQEFAIAISTFVKHIHYVVPGHAGIDALSEDVALSEVLDLVFH